MVGSTGATVVVVEDDPSMRKAIERLLRTAGFGCATYDSADALLAQGLERNSGCVISDLKLPGMSGLELIAALRERRIALPFILITAHDAPGLRERAIAHGATAYLAKPFRGTALLAAVRGVLEAPSP